MNTRCFCAVPQQFFVSLLSVTWLSSKWRVILGTALSVFLLLTFVYILEHVPNCLWLNIAQTARLRFIDTKEAGRREWLAGHLCLLAADSDVIDVVHVSVQWLWCVTEAAVQKHWQGADPWQHSLFPFEWHSKSYSKAVCVGDALLSLQLGLLETSHGSWGGDLCFSLGGRGLLISRERNQGLKRDKTVVTYRNFKQWSF